MARSGVRVWDMSAQSSIRRWLVRDSRLIGAFAAAVSLLLGAACSSRPAASSYLEGGTVARDSIKAEALTRRASELLDKGRSDEAERLLREALAADLFHGPAHNNLGVVLLQKGELYEAAGEFEWARKLMPGHPDPRFNLALTLERAGRVDDSLAMYGSALEVHSEFVPAMQAIARLSLRRGRGGEHVDAFLETIALRGDSESWRAWAQEQLAMRSGTREQAAATR
jgi:Tfp pilus assembly protein PilF